MTGRSPGQKDDGQGALSTSMHGVLACLAYCLRFHFWTKPGTWSAGDLSTVIICHAALGTLCPCSHYPALSIPRSWPLPSGYHQPALQSRAEQQSFPQQGPRAVPPELGGGRDEGPELISIVPDPPAAPAVHSGLFQGCPCPGHSHPLLWTSEEDGVLGEPNLCP